MSAKLKLDDYYYWYQTVLKNKVYGPASWREICSLRRQFDLTIVKKVLITEYIKEIEEEAIAYRKMAAEAQWREEMKIDAFGERNGD